MTDFFHNLIVYPSVVMQLASSHVRTIRPIAHDRTEIRVYPIRLKGAPEEINRQLVRYLNVTHSAGSLIQSDDVEMFRRVQGWLKTGGRFFMHVFVHRSTPYAFVDKDDSDWMSRHFFSGGMMPSDELPLRFQDDLRFVQRWRWDGRHYEKTANAWLANLDDRRDQAMSILEQTYGKADAAMWLQRWRVFFMACAELFRYQGGREWFVSHYRFVKGA